MLGGIGGPVSNKWFDTTVFTQPTGVTFGNTGRNQFRGPGAWNVDFALFRTFPVGGQRKLEFRFQANNIFNHAVFANPASGITGAHVRTDHRHRRRRLLSGTPAAARTAVPVLGRQSFATALRPGGGEPHRAVCLAARPSFAMLKRMRPRPAHVLVALLLLGVSSGLAAAQAPSAAAAAGGRDRILPRPARPCRASTRRRPRGRPMPGAVGALAARPAGVGAVGGAHQAYGRCQALAPAGLRVALPRRDRPAAAGAARRGGSALQAGLDRRARLPACPRRSSPRRCSTPAPSTRAGGSSSRSLREPRAEPAAELGLGRDRALPTAATSEASRDFERAVALFPELGAALLRARAVVSRRGPHRDARTRARAARAVRRALAGARRSRARRPSRRGETIAGAMLAARRDARRRRATSRARSPRTRRRWRAIRRSSRRTRT